MNAHELSADCLFEGVCSIADGYAFGVGPDLKSFSASMRRVPVLRPAPPWTYCAVCGEGSFRFGHDWVTNPAPFVSVLPNLDAVVWSSEGGGRLVTSSLSQSLRQSLVNPSVVWVPASEPISMTNDHSLPTALLLSADGSMVLDAIARGNAGFELAVADRGGRDKGMAGITMATTAEPPPPRIGFAAAWSRTASALYVIGGKEPSTEALLADAWTLDMNGVWRSVPIDSAHAPRNARAAVFSMQDWRVWILDRRPLTFPLRGSGWRLLRIDPATGIVETDIPLPALELFEDAYLATMEDGKVVLVATGAETHAVAFLTTARIHGQSRVRFVGARFGLGRVMAQPTVRHGLLSLPVRKRSLFGLEESIVPIGLRERDCREAWNALTTSFN